MAVLVGAVGVLVVGVVLLEVFEGLVLARRVTRPFRLSRFYYQAAWRAWRNLGWLMPRRRRETWLGAFGPLSLLVLFALWAAGLMLGFALLHYAASPGMVSGDALYLSGTTFTTLGYGDVNPSGAGG